MKILLVDDDPDQIDVTAYALRREGFSVIMATDGAQALRRWRDDSPDFVILEVGLPHLSGFEICHKIRQAGHTPVMILSELDDDDHVVKGFQAGADDYVAKPFSPHQLVMRIRAILRRSGLNPAAAERHVQVGDLLVDLESHEVQRGAEVILLTPLEFRLLSILVSNIGRVVSASRLVEYAWGYGDGDVALLKTHICHLRRKLGLATDGAGSVCAVPGVGYRLVPPSVPEVSAQTSRQLTPTRLEVAC